MDDNLLGVISHELDDYLVQFAMKYKVTPLNLSSILLARLAHLNNSFNSKDDYIKLLESVSDTLVLDKHIDNTNNLH
jgi:hypothetical protein